jgi:hypothetical protein
VGDETHNLDWAKHSLSAFGPNLGSAGDAYWTLQGISEGGLPGVIESKRHLKDYIYKAFLQRATCAAIFFYHYSLSLPTTSFPGSDAQLVDRSDFAGGGRSGLELVFHSQPLCLFEMKRVCRSTDQANTLEKLGNKWDEWPENMMDGQGYVSIELQDCDLEDRGYTELKWYPEGWQKKAQKILYQVCVLKCGLLTTQQTLQAWHQLLIRNCEHVIICTEKQFLLAFRNGNTLFISPSYTFQSDSPQECHDIMINLFFLHTPSSSTPSS